MENPFEALPVLQDMPPDEQTARLMAIGEEEIARRIADAGDREEPGRRDASFNFFRGAAETGRARLYLNTTHTFGFIPATTTGTDIPLQDASTIGNSDTLANTPITVTLNLLRVAGYPGKGVHRVLFDFYARNTVGRTVEDVHFNATYRVSEGQQAGVKGYPIFVGLNVGPNGVAFRGYTVNVRNDNDHKLLDIIDSDVFRSGLKLATSLQPAIKPLSEMALGLTKALASRHDNVPVQDFYLGLDTGGTPMGARLAEGDYVIVQLPQSEFEKWDWSHWGFSRSAGRITAVGDTTKSIPYNHLVIGVRRHVEPAGKE
jgi:hypothetical protein